MADYTAAEASKLEKWSITLQKLNFGTAFRLVQTTLTTAVANLATETAKVLALKSGIADVASHDYSGGNTKWTLSTAEKLCPYILTTNAGTGTAVAEFGAKATIGNKVIEVRNSSGQTVTFKPSDATGISVATGKSARLLFSATDADFIRLTPDTTF